MRSISAMPTPSVVADSKSRPFVRQWLGPLLCCIFILTAGCTLDDGRLTQTVDLDGQVGAGGEFDCTVRLQNLAGNVTIEARTPEQDRPDLAQIPTSEIATTTSSDAVFHWRGETDATDVTLAPAMFFDEEGVLVVEDGCDAIVETGASCAAEIHAWIPAACHLEVLLGVGEESTVVGFSGSLDLTALEANALTIEHDGQAKVSATTIHDAVFYCGDGTFEFEVGGELVSCEDTSSPL